MQPWCGPLNVLFYCLPAAWHLFKKGLLTLSQYWKIRHCLPKRRLFISLADTVTGPRVMFLALKPFLASLWEDAQADR